MPIQDTAFAKDLVRRYLNDVFSRGDLGVIDQYLSGDTFTGGVVDLVTRWRNLNYSTEETSERVHAAFGDEKFSRLVGLKSKWDPDNRFRFNHNIPPPHS